MQIVLKDGYVDSYASLGDLLNGISVNEPKDLGHFEKHYRAYKYENGKFIFDESKEKAIDLEQTKEELRKRRKEECFSVVDRSQLWYNHLTSEQLQDLEKWYNDWLVVTETLVVPEKPNWL